MTTFKLKREHLFRSVFKSNSRCLKVVVGKTYTLGTPIVDRLVQLMPRARWKMKILFHSEISVSLISSIHRRRPAAAE